MIPTSDRVPSRWSRYGLWTVLFVLIGCSRLQAQSITEYTVPTASGFLEWITSGPDGALWFCEAGAGKIGRITTSGTITEYTVPTANSFPVVITPGPDGALWFTEWSANKIGRITTSGTITEYTLPAIGGGPGGIIAGPDGALWFTGYNGNKIGRIDHHVWHDHRVHRADG
jgi:virginiamycin B lyase